MGNAAQEESGFALRYAPVIIGLSPRYWATKSSLAWNVVEGCTPTPPIITSRFVAAACRTGAGAVACQLPRASGPKSKKFGKTLRISVLHVPKYWLAV